jgi:methionyl aminopeptidase
MIKIKSPEEIDDMRESCQIAALILDEAANMCAPGVTTSDLNDFAQTRMEEFGAESAFINYRGYPAHICTSVNDEVVHGIPTNRRLKMGDIVSIDIGTIYAGWVGDNARTVMIGVQDPEIIRLVKTTEEALHAGISKAIAGGRLTDISHAVEKVATAAGLDVVKEFVGHGVGRKMHEEPQIPNFGPPGKGPKLRAGMTLAIEPMINLGTPEVEVLPDGWTVLTGDRMPSAHFEHTVLVRDSAPEVLTCKKMN